MSKRSGDRSKLPATGYSVRKLVVLALLFAMAIALGMFENILPPLPAPVPLRYGLSNIAVMYALFFLGLPSAYTIAILKGIFAVMTRGLIAGLTSLSGGLISVTCMYMLKRLTGDRVSYSILGVSGAVSHNLGQYLLIILLDYLRIPVLAFLPLLLFTGIVTGLLSSALLRAALPALKRWRYFSDRI
ncbi:MAG: Gx transporter family protein [Saccharofermentanales bacterium]|jgi:heptaprenyl diphosphate synthase|nr:Gx transporter family protein [Bacillota bacterium]NLB08380.1 Gx transporter family protein [Clostridiales bacterium]